MKSRFSLFFLLAFLEVLGAQEIPTAVSGIPVLHLTLQDALWLASTHNEEFQFANERQILLFRRQRHFFGKFLPRFGVNGEIGATENVNFVDSRSTYYHFKGSLGLYLNWDVFDYNLYTAWERVKIDSTQGKVDQKILSQQLEKDIRQKFYKLLLQKEEIKYQKANVLALESTYNENLAKYERGATDWVELIKSQTEWELEMPNTEKMEFDFIQNKKRLMLDLSLPMDKEIELLGSFDTLLFAMQDRVEKGAYLERLDFQKSNTTLNSQRNKLAYAKLEDLQKKIEYFPRLSFKMGASYPLGSFDKYQYSEDWKRVGAEHMSFSASLVLSWQLSDYLWYSSWQQERALRTLEREEAEEIYRKTVITQNFELKNLIEKINSKKNELKKRLTLVDLNSRRLQEAHLLFERGTAPYNVVLHAVKIKEAASLALARGQMELLLLYQDLIMMY